MQNATTLCSVKLHSGPSSFPVFSVGRYRKMGKYASPMAQLKCQGSDDRNKYVVKNNFNFIITDKFL